MKTSNTKWFINGPLCLLLQAPWLSLAGSATAPIPLQIAQEAYLKASNTGGGDNFGTSVAVSGDTVAVGAPYEGSNATGVNGDQSEFTDVSAPNHPMRFYKLKWP